jgi:hypothetical protein
MQPPRTAASPVEPIDMVPVTDLNGNTMYASRNDANAIAWVRLIDAVVKDPSTYLEALAWMAGGLAGLWLVYVLLQPDQPSRAELKSRKSWISGNDDFAP